MVILSIVRAGRIPAASLRSARIPASVALLLVAGCAAPEWNGVRKSRAEQQLAFLDAEVERHRKRVNQRQAELRQLQGELTDLVVDVRVERGRRNQQGELLADELTRLAAIEEDAKAARKRRKVLEGELRGVRELEAQLASRDRRLQELTGQIAARRAAVEKAEAEAKAAETAAAEKEAAIRAQMAALKERDAELASLLERVRALLPPEPAGDPAGQTNDGAPKDGDKQAGGEKNAGQKKG